LPCSRYRSRGQAGLNVSLGVSGLTLALAP
jgi:hypothetical protein